MTIKHIKIIIPKYWLMIATLFLGINSIGQTCDFTINNNGGAGGDTEYFLVLDAAGNIAEVIAGPGPINISSQAVGTVTEVLHLIYDSSNLPTNVPPVLGDDPGGIVGCTNDHLSARIILECLCEEDEISATYTPGGGDVLIYYLVDPADGSVLDSNSSGNFGTDELVGEYFIHALSYSSTSPPTILPTIGGNILDFSGDGCYNPDFLSSACCAQKISCCDMMAEVNLAATTCDAPNGNLIFTIDVTAATGTITGDMGATFIDNGGGSWTGSVNVIPGSVLTVTVNDDVQACDQEVLIDATNIVCDDMGNPVCALVGLLSIDVNDYICNADGTITCEITISGAAGTSVSIDGNAIGGGNGTYSITVPGPMGTIVLTDPDGFLNGACQTDLVYDLSDILPSTPPILSPALEIVLCPGVPVDPIMASGSTGTTFNWYTDAGLTIAVNSSEVDGVNNEIFMPSVVPPGTTMYYVVEVNAGGCESPATEFSYTRTECGADGGRF